MLIGYPAPIEMDFRTQRSPFFGQNIRLKPTVAPILAKNSEEKNSDRKGRKDEVITGSVTVQLNHSERKLSSEALVYINNPMLDILFDEKIAGSFHFTPGQAYEEADNGVRSSVHWDMVMIQTSEHGGGEISFDGRLIRKDGRFIVPELEGLNPENLKSP